MICRSTTLRPALTLIPMLLAGSALAASPWVHRTVGADDLLPAAQAFQLLAAERSGEAVTVTWAIAPGYYLYRKRLGFEAVTPTAARLDAPRLPKGESVADEREGRTEVYRVALKAQLRAQAGTPLPEQLRVQYQGCADAGVCYPPVTAVVDVTAAPR